MFGEQLQKNLILLDKNPEKAGKLKLIIKLNGLQLEYFQEYISAP